MRAARTAAFFALSTPTVATGTPGGICTIESSASSPSSTRHRRAQRHADHRQLGVRRDDARAAPPRGRRRRSAPSGRARAALFAYSATASGVRCAERTSNSHADPARVELVHRRLHALAVGLRADEDADERSSGTRRCRAGTARPRRRSGRPPRTRGRAPRRRVGPVAVTERIRPPFVTTVPLRTAVPPWKTSAPAASAAAIPSIGAPA